MPLPETDAPPAEPSLRQQVDAEVQVLQPQIERSPVVAVIAEVGLFGGGAPFAREEATRLSFGEALPAPPASHGEEVLQLGTVEGVPAAWMSARHIGHGFSAQEASLSVRVLAALGTRAFVLLGRAASLGEHISPGDVMLLTDHLNLQGANPLMGANEADWGPRFPDMTAPYDADWRTAVQEGANGSLHEGIYAAVPGPAPATPAEQAMLQRMGADAVGAGLVPEVLTARHMERRVLAAVAITEPRADAQDGAAQDEAAVLASLVRAAIQQVSKPT